MEFRNLIKSKLLEKRPNLHEKSLLSYISTLVNLPKKLNDQPNDVQYFTDNVDRIIQHLKDKPSRTRKSVLSPLVVLTQIDKYKLLMQSDIEVFDDTVRKQEKTNKELANWIKWTSVIEKYAQLQVTFLAGIKAKAAITANLFDEMNSFMLLSLYVLFPPRRALDYAVMKYKNYDRQKDNFIDINKKIMVFNEYKTFNKYGTQKFDLSKDLIKIIKLWIKALVKLNNNDSDYLIITNQQNSVDITKLLNAIFKPKKVSVNMLRHSFLTHFYEQQNGIPDLETMERLASAMGHSVQAQLQYIRKD